MKTKTPKSLKLINFNFDFLIYDIETYLDKSNTFQLYQFGLYHLKIEYKFFYGVKYIQQVFDFILNYNYNTIKIIFLYIIVVDLILLLFLKN